MSLEAGSRGGRHNLILYSIAHNFHTSFPSTFKLGCAESLPLFLQVRCELFVLFLL